MNMHSKDLNFYIGDRINLEGITFKIVGYITFQGNDGVKWTEYKIKATEGYRVKWLSIDSTYNEYAIYDECSDSDDFLEKNIVEKGYRKVDSDAAKVVAYKGDVDVDLGEEVYYKEYEDNTEELILSVEDWDGEVEYSKGYYVDKEDIEKITHDMDNTYAKAFSFESIDQVSSSTIKKTAIAIIGIIIVIVLFSKIGAGGYEDKEALSKYINSNSSFVYVTSMTSDLDNSKKANVYSTDKTVEETAKILIEAVKGNIEDAQESQEDGTAIITTKDELSLIYISEDSQTLIQVSSRAYVYSSRSTPYRSSHLTGGYYRRYYYSRAYQQDKPRYSNSPDAYTDYNDGTVTTDDNNKYRTYSNSIRQSSISSRTSSGGGISSGK